MDKEMANYIANLIASALLGGKNNENDEILRDEHEKIVKKILE